MSKPINPKRLLNDLAKELDGETMESTFLFKGHEFTISLLNEEETNWRNGFVNTGTSLSTLSSWRLPTLAIGIRYIDGVSVYEFFADQWNETEEGRQVRALIEGRGRFSRKYFVAEHMMEWLAERDTEVMEEMWDHWLELEKRREEAQESIKKSSGEASDTDTRENGTEASPSGDE
jgi:hypothetical protein